MRKPSNTVLSVVFLVLAAGTTFAQDAKKVDPAVVAPAPAAPVAMVPVAAWSSPEIETIAKHLTGSWKSKTAIAQGNDPSKTTEVVLSFAHVNIEGMSDAVYVEQARAGQLHRPDRESVFQFYKAGDKVRIRTFEFRRTPGRGSSTTGAWLAPEMFPVTKASDLVGTMDLTVSAAGNAFVAKSTHPYPTALAGATEMTSEFKFGPDSISTNDVGLDATGKTVWTAASEFTKFDPGVAVTHAPNGLVVIDYVKGGGGEDISAGDSYSVEYEGWLANGYKFDSSRDRADGGAPRPLDVNPGMGLIQGWVEGVLGAHKGTIRRMMIPGNMAYVGMRRGMIPANAPLYFEIEVLSVRKGAPAKVVTPEIKKADH